MLWNIDQYGAIDETRYFYSIFGILSLKKAFRTGLKSDSLPEKRANTGRNSSPIGL